MANLTPVPDTGLHTALIKKRLPPWIAHTAEADIRRLHRGLLPGRVPPGLQPAWLTHASAELRAALSTSQQRSHASNQALARTLKSLKGPAAFAQPLLEEAVSKRFGQALDVNKNALFHLRYREPTEQHTLVQAALLNFEGNEDFSREVLGETSALAPLDALQTHYGEMTRAGSSSARYRYREKLPVTPDDFATLCRTLDLGKQYQDHLTQVFDAPDKAPQVRAHMIQAQKDLLAVRLHTARMKQELSESFYRVLLKLLAGLTGLTLDDRPIGYSQLSILGCPLGEVVLIGSAGGRLVAWMPGAPLYPLKEYASLQAFEQDLAINLRSPVYQRLLASRVPQGDAPAFLKRLKEKLFTYRWNAATGVLEQVYDQTISLNLRETPIRGELFGALYEKHVQRLKDEALKIAVPTAEADRKAARERLQHWLDIGLNLLNVAAFFVPGLGELMLAVAAIQLGLEVYHGIEAWKQGDLDAAWAHLESVALNVAFMATLAGTAALASRAPVIQVSKWVDAMVPVKLPNGEARLWKPDLEPYRSDVVLDPTLEPNAQGQYEVDGKIYVRIGDGVYEKGFDTQLKKWRIKHPSDPAAYQPELHTNHSGAWRAIHERPREWGRLTLLRRLGHATRSFSDETLASIGDISGVSDEALCKAHIDGLPVPAPLADTLRQFRFDQQADDLIAQIRRGTGLDRRYEYALPLVVQLPRWPAGRVLEVFEGPEPWGRSQVYGRPSSPTDVRASIKVTRGEVLNGKLPQRVLAQINEQETTDMLGSQASNLGADKEQMFNGRLADYARKRKKALFDSLSSPTAATLPESEWLQRRFPMLPREAMAEVLAHASESERVQMQTGGTVPVRLDNLARAQAQQVRLSRAIAGMQRETLASVDSDRLALRSLERLPGWPGNIRLEVRLDSVGGALLDSIGLETAPVRKYLVKDGETYLACDERGEALHSKVPGERNFFRSIMHALPDDARRGLGLPLVSQDAELQRILVRYGVTHRSVMTGILKQRAVRSRPGIRLQSGRLGYGLTGRGDAFVADSSLVARVRDLYPDLSEEQAGTFVLGRLGSGDSTQQVFHLLATRQREFDGLRATLDAWATPLGGEPARAGAGRRLVAQALINCWRSNLYRGLEPFAYLDLAGERRLPALQADFSHVRGLQLQGAAVLGEEGAALLEQFANAQALQLYVQQSELGAVAERLRSLPRVTQLSVDGHLLNYGPELEPMLNAMPQLQHLSLTGAMERLDVSGLLNLRSLRLGGSLAIFPDGLAGLAHLERVDLWGTRIDAVPKAFFQGHERLWRGLQMNWPAFDPDDFMAVFEYLHDNPAHLVDVERLAQNYCEGSLRRLKSARASLLHEPAVQFNPLELPALERVRRINALRKEHSVFVAQLETWKTREIWVDRQSVEFYYRQEAAEHLLECWREGLDRRLLGDQAGPAPGINNLDLSGGLLGELPQLPPPEAFAHVQSLNLNGVRVSTQALDGFLANFRSLRRLDLAHNNLAALPSGLAELRALEHLDLSHNQLTLTHATQQQLNGLGSLQELSLAYNRIGRLDVRALTQLRGLSLSHTGITAWPEGVLQLTGLRRLDLSNSAITDVPQALLSEDHLLMRGTNLRGCRLSPQAMTDMHGFAQRLGIESPLGITRQMLTEGHTGGDPEYFPPEVADRPGLLIALPVEPVGGEARLTPAARLQRLDPALSSTQAVQRIDELEAQGIGAECIEARLTQWREQHQVLVRQLNDWLDIRGYREGQGWVNALDRRRAADRLLQSWRHTLRATPDAGSHLLDLSELYLGDLPPLSNRFDHVRELNLRGVKLTEQGSNAFLRAFPQVRTLVLSHNGLRGLPEAVSELSQLTRLEASRNELREVAQLQSRLNAMPALVGLDLSENLLQALDITRLPALETLDLHDNSLVGWPEGVLEAPRLRTLDLRNNQIETVPANAWALRHRPLMVGTDLSDNLLLEHEFLLLRDYLLDTGNGLGFTEAEIDQLLEGYAIEEQVVGNGDGEAHPELLSPQAQKEQWFGDVPVDSQKHAVWEELKAEEGNSAFFYIIAQLKNAKDFVLDRAELTRRVWDVLETVHGQPELREMLFARARTSMEAATCGDGWALLFSDLEVGVYEFKALQNVAPGQEGLGLFKLARGMIRLEEVEARATAAIRQRPGVDPAEVRLAYRIGLAQRLELPRQPSSMLYRSLAHVTQADIDSAYTGILASENVPGFADKLVVREYWMDYLKRTYPAEFSTVAQHHSARVEALDALHPELNQQYLEASVALDEQRKQETTALALQLTARERAAFGL